MAKDLRRELDTARVRLEAESRIGEERAAEFEKVRTDKAALQARTFEMELKMREMQAELDKTLDTERESRRALAETKEESRSNTDSLSRCMAIIRQMHSSVCRGSKTAGGVPGGVGITVCSIGGKIVVKSVAEGGSADASGEIAAGET